MNPPMPEWNDLRNADRLAIAKEWEIISCPHACSGDVSAMYDAIREALLERERYYYRAAMDGAAP